MCITGEVNRKNTPILYECENCYNECYEHVAIRKNNDYKEIICIKCYRKIKP